MKKKLWLLTLYAIFIMVLTVIAGCRMDNLVVDVSCFGCSVSPCICKPLPANLSGKWYSTQDGANEADKSDEIYEFMPNGILMIKGRDNGTTYRIKEDDLISIKYKNKNDSVSYVILGNKLSISGTAFLLEAGTYYKSDAEFGGDCMSCFKKDCPYPIQNVWVCLSSEAGFVPGKGGFGGAFTGDIYSSKEPDGMHYTNPKWASQIGKHFLFSYTDNDGIPTGIGPVSTEDEFFGNVLMGYNSGAMLGVLFEKYIDISDANTINLNIYEGSGSNWSGGILLFHNEENPKQPKQAQWWSGGRDISGQYLFGLSNFRLLDNAGKPIPANNPAGDPDWTKLVGFALKANGFMIVTGIEVIDQPPLYIPKECDCELYFPSVGSFPGGERQVTEPEDLAKFRNAPEYSYLVLYYTQINGTGTIGRFGPSSSTIHIENCPCGNPAGQGNIQLLNFPSPIPAGGPANTRWSEVPITNIWKLMDCQGDGSTSSRFFEGNFNINPYGTTSSSNCVLGGVVLHIPKNDPRPACNTCD